MLLTGPLFDALDFCHVVRSKLRCSDGCGCEVPVGLRVKFEGVAIDLVSLLIEAKSSTAFKIPRFAAEAPVVASPRFHSLSVRHRRTQSAILKKISADAPRCPAASGPKL